LLFILKNKKLLIYLVAVYIYKQKKFAFYLQIKVYDFYMTFKNNYFYSRRANKRLFLETKW